MRVAQVFTQGGRYSNGGGYDHDGYDCGCQGGPYRRTGYFYRRHGSYYKYNDGVGYAPRPHYGDLLGL